MHACMHACTYLHHITSYTYTDMSFGMLQMQLPSYLLLFRGTERCHPLADCSACGLNVSMGFGVMEARLAATICV